MREITIFIQDMRKRIEERSMKMKNAEEMIQGIRNKISDILLHFTII